MKRRIQKSMGVVLWITLFVSCVIFICVFYLHALNTMHNTVDKEAFYISEAINLSELANDVSEADYIDTIVEYIGDSRITLIDVDGTVIYDTEEDCTEMENHGTREEVLEAIATGQGTSTRFSSTIGLQTYYCAIVLDNGKVIRVAQTMDTVARTIVDVSPFIFGLGFLLWVLSLVMANLQTKRLIEPINKLNLEAPLENEIYEELQPLINRLEHNNNEKAEIENMRREFSANVSHELKTPLTSISGYAELMQNGLVPPQHVERFSGKIYSEANRLIVLVEDIIKISKLDEGSIELEKEDVDLYFMVREICSRLSLQANRKKVHMEISGQSVKVYGVKPVLDEMIYNICENAIKYNKDNGRIDIWVGATLSGAKVVVKDTGIGIPKDQQERVFERFYRVDKSHSKETGGTGLGLSIVKHGAALHNAQISLESEENIGTKIEVRF